MREMVGETQEDQVLMARAAWLYYIGGLNQEATAKRLGLTRARVNKLLADARDMVAAEGVVVIGAELDHRPPRRIRRRAQRHLQGVHRRALKERCGRAVPPAPGAVPQRPASARGR